MFFTQELYCTDYETENQIANKSTLGKDSSHK